MAPTVFEPVKDELSRNEDKAPAEAMPRASELARDASAPSGGHLVLYESLDRGWEESVMPEEFFKGVPDVEPYLEEGGRTPFRKRMLHFLGSLVIASAVVLLILHEWKPLEPTPSVGDWALPDPIELDLAPVALRSKTSAANRAVETTDWGTVLRETEGIWSEIKQNEDLQHEVASSPDYQTWLVGCLVSVPVKMSEDSSGDSLKEELQNAVRNYEETAVDAGYRDDVLACFSYINAKSRQHQSNNLSEPTAKTEYAKLEELLALILDLRKRHGAAFKGDRKEAWEKARDLDSIEGYVLAKRLFESKKNFLGDRFDKDDEGNQSRWKRLESVILDLKAQPGFEANPIYLDLHEYLLVSALTFADRIGNETVTIGSWSAKEKEIEAQLRTVRGHRATLEATNKQ